MGFIKDSLSSAFGAGQVNNGLGGPRLPFGNSKKSTAQYRQEPSYYDDSPPPYDGDSNDYQPRRTYGGRADFDDYPQSSRYESRTDDYEYPQSSQYAYGDSWRNEASSSRGSRNSFRPVILPQINFGDGQPFLRAYSPELQQYGIQERQFIELVDAINVANIPNPENLIFQKAASVAGWFVPGVEGIGIMGGQVLAGLGAHLGHASMMNKVLSTANLETFLPVGLEICIGKTVNVDQATGVDSTYDNRFTQVTPEQRLQLYGNRVAVLSTRYPPVTNAGRQDPIAMLGRGMTSRDNQRKMERLNRNMQRGREKDVTKATKALQWLIVRQASPDAIAYWRKKLAESNAEIEQAQNQAQQQRYGQSRR